MAATGQSEGSSGQVLHPTHLWQRSRRGTPPPPRDDFRPGHLLAAIGVLVLWNFTANLLVSDGFSLPLSVGAVAILVAIARRGGASWDYLGLRREDMGRGLRAGMPVTTVVVATIALVAAIPASREYLADERFVGVPIAEMLYDVLIRIPIGTALAEEIAFRGVLLGLLLLWTSPRRAVLAASALFGLWHVLPGLDALETNPGADLASGTLATVLEVGVQVVVTGLAGAGLAWLRFRGRSITAPALAHWGLNGAAYLAGWLVIRYSWA